MTEKELISKIKALKSIQPEKDWVLMTKTQILGGRQRPALFNWFTSRAFLMVSALTIVLIGGIFFYNNSVITPKISPKTVSVDPATLEAITTGLRTVESDIVRATANLEKVKTPTKVLEVKDTVSSALENGERIVTVAKKLTEEPKDKKPPEVLTAISGVESALENMEETYFEKQKDMAERLIKELEEKSLTEEQKALFKEAKDYYNEGNFSEALMKAIEASQIR